ncbi:SET domain-containing protein-lysine N-methyltransferase [Pseudomonas poae]|uniref:SET domain-containing protein-lysine N-methyltransferase n=1 Tax=Pseudomonas poae TaxID=200451 RepID=A0A2S9EPD1_9PSED|nr:SET domain-containing protein-lysine N-methyltransferase [Pseudomonas poae]PRA26407.1 SET domain-containing protein-lysine N-methyltransferase [Pseudomonas poae]PRC17327.1 SET domain-containing protein-lysine N-methyltransferase [Pseudomonas poae]
MKTQAMDKAKTVTPACLYPFKSLTVEQGYPSTQQFQVERNSIKARVHFDSRVRIARISGWAVGERRLHTVQLSPRIHLYDSWFCGLLQHSCDPNVFVDTTYLEIWSLRPILPGEPLTMDYATTEDMLFRQFPCECHALSCRRWITGSQQQLNAEGQAFMARWRDGKQP